MSNDNRFDDPGVGELEPGARVDRGESHSMSKKDVTKQPWDVEIDVHLKKACPDPEFEIYTTLPVVGGNILFENNHRPGFNICFNLIDETNSGYVFPPQSQIDEACWSAFGSECPKSPAYEVFELRHVDHDGTSLYVYNKNPSPPGGPFQYTLRVTNDGCKSFCALDPGGNDMNGPRA
jgi:hypothetical protein